MRLGAHVDFEEPAEALAVRSLDGDEGVGVQRQVEGVVAGGTNFDGAFESRLVAEGIAEGPAKRPVAGLGREPEGEQGTPGMSERLEVGVLYGACWRQP